MIRASAAICRTETPSNPRRANSRVATRWMRPLVVIYLPFGKASPQKLIPVSEDTSTIARRSSIVKCGYFFFLTTRFSLTSTRSPHSGHI